MVTGHLESCECSECQAARAQGVRVVPSVQNVTALLAGFDPQAAEIFNSPAYVICIGGIPSICVLGGNSEFAMEHIVGNLVFSIADDPEVPDRLAVQVFAVALRGQDQIVPALNDLTNVEALRAAAKRLGERVAKGAV